LCSRAAKEDGSVKHVVVPKNPKLDGDKLTFNVQTLEGDLAGRLYLDSPTTS
jgi:hypothetical protein